MVAFTHVSVLPDAVMSYWPADPAGWYLDATVGGGGHSRLLLDRLPQANLIAVDQDPAALAEARRVLSPFDGRVSFYAQNFRDLPNVLAQQGIDGVDGVLFDLGVSSPQFDVPERGFSYHVDAPLDMRMDPENPVTAFRLVNMKSRQEITAALRDYGEERWASRIAQFIVEARTLEPIRTTGQLVEVVKAAIPASARRTGGHPARRTFQALRIWVNDELEALKDGLKAGLGVLNPNGHLVVISFHSLEDRIVKHQFREWQQNAMGKVLTTHPVVPDETETEVNSRARSAKLRAFQR